MPRRLTFAAASRRAFAVACCSIVMSPALARAEDPPPFTIGGQPAWYLLGGVTGGYTVAGVDHRGGFVGLELSLARLREDHYVGGYADGYYDFGVDGMYASTGLELGWKLIGVDGGVALRAAGETAVGATARLVVSAGVFALYARYAHFAADRDSDVFQVGAMLKLPLHSPFGVRR
jgi:hypothetical protein